jgi:hypothetical protein
MLAPHASVSHMSSVDTYLDEHFPEQKLSLNSLGNERYGMAYKHCLSERTLRNVAERVGVIWPMKGTAKPKVFHDTGMVIKLDDLARWAGINAGSFKNIRASVAKARVARERLRRQSALSLDQRDASAVNILKVLLSEEQVVYPDLGQTFNMADGEWDAIRMTADSLDRLVKRILDKYDGDYT